MDFHYLDLVAYIIICILAWIFSPEEMAIIGWFFAWIIFTIIWIVIFIYPLDLDISDLLNIHLNIKMTP